MTSTEHSSLESQLSVRCPARMADTLRVLAMDAVQQANSGHPGMPMGMAEIAVALWDAAPETRPGRSAPGRPRPFRAVERSWLDADVRRCCI
jgi:transketolase N-terminal domain/subunit